MFINTMQAGVLVGRYPLCIRIEDHYYIRLHLDPHLIYANNRVKTKYDDPLWLMSGLFLTLFAQPAGVS